jgi:hypothetical protein
MIVIAILYALMLPTKPKGYGLSHYIVMLLQWVIVPVTLIIFGSLPAADAQPG